MNDSKHGTMPPPDDEEPVAKERRSYTGLAVASSVILLVAVVGFVASRAGIDRATVEQRVREAEAGLNEMLKPRGYQATLAYDDLALSGGLFSRMVTLKNPVLEFAHPNPLSPYNGTKIRLEQLSFVPGDSSLQTAEITLPSPVEIINPRHTYVISGEPALVIDVAAQEGERSWEADFPASFSITRDGKEIRSGTLGEGSGSHVVQNSTTGALKKQIMLKDSKLHIDEAELAIDELAMYSDITKDEGMLSEEYSLKLDKLTPAGTLTPLGPVSAELKAKLKASEQGKLQMLEVGPLSITGEGYRVEAGSEWKFNASEILPYGNAGLKVTGARRMVDAVGKAKLLGPVELAVLESALLKTSGQDALSDEQEIAIHIERQSGGPFKIGNTTFEELAASVFQELLRPAATGDGQLVVPPAAGDMPQTEDGATDGSVKDTLSDTGDALGEAEDRLDSAIESLEKITQEPQEAPASPAMDHDGIETE